MNKSVLTQKRRAISPIIATLLLILIAIAAGVVVYAYVIGFIGNSTTNGGNTTNTISIDEATLKGTSAARIPVVAFVRNLGPSTESFNTGFFVKGASLNDQLGFAVSVTDSSGDAITNVTLQGTGVANQIQVSLTFGTCATGHTASVSVFGATATVSCTATSGSFVATAAVTGFTFTNSAITGNLASVASTVTLSGTATVIGLTTTSGATVSLPISQVGQMTLAQAGVQTTNPLSAGQTYTVQVTGTDGGSAVASAKAS